MQAAEGLRWLRTCWAGVPKLCWGKKLRGSES